jgi:hypothetical protein
LNFNPKLTPESYPFQKFLTYSCDIYGRHGFYLDHLQRFLHHFPREQLLVLLYDDLKAAPLRYLQRTFRFLGVSDSFAPPAATEQINQMPLRIPTRAPGKIAKRLQRLPGIMAMKQALARRRHVAMMADAEHRGYLMTAEIQQQMRDMFQEHNQHLGSFLGRDLSHWNQPTESAKQTRTGHTVQRAA